MNDWLDAPDSNGLWWITKDGKDFDVVSVTLTHLDGSAAWYPISIIDSDDCYTLEDYAGYKWQKAVPPAFPGV